MWFTLWSSIQLKFIQNMCTFHKKWKTRRFITKLLGSIKSEALTNFQNEPQTLKSNKWEIFNLAFVSPNLSGITIQKQSKMEYKMYDFQFYEHLRYVLFVRWNYVRLITNCLRDEKQQNNFYIGTKLLIT